MKINIAIDGPSAAGKSTIADLLAARHGYIHLDTGAMYRCTAYKALQEGIALDDEEALGRMLQETKMKQTPDHRFFLDGQDVSEAIRHEEISRAASQVSRFAGVRRDLVKRQQEMASEKGYILDGRDIGTVVLPDAEVKIFLTASVQARARRRYEQDKEKGILTQTLEEVEHDIARRDDQDIHRQNSPLRAAADAVVIDTSDLSIPEVVERIDSYVQPWLKKGEQTHE
jgi:cytidylate kinase